MKKTILLKPFKEFEVIDFKDDLHYYYEKIQCECIDIVQPHIMNHLDKKFQSKQFCLIVDDEGLLVENPQLNLYASTVYGNTIFGNALVCKELHTEDGIYTVGLNDDDIEVFFKAIQDAIEKVKGL